MYRLAVNNPLAMANSHYNQNTNYTALDSTHSLPSYEQEHRAPAPAGGCGFCRRNRESTTMIHSHRLKDDQGRVLCPQLRRYICPGCGATGDEAHTRSYCPNVVRARQMYDQRNASSQDSNSGSGSSPTRRDHSHSQQQQLASSGSTSASSTQPQWPSTSSGNSSQSPRSQQQHEHSVIQMARMGANPRARRAAGAAARTQFATQFANQLTQTISTGSPPAPAETQDDGEHGDDEEDPGEEGEVTIELGANRSFYNMSRVTNSRYNSAGQLRNRRGGRWINSAAQASSQQGHGRGGHRW